ncbi:MAG: hypothetical protein LBH17_03585, partial [Oscillospiraceae bacterium]|nr:hypothetical protein [Oscillospiraceae bacterium]
MLKTRIISALLSLALAATLLAGCAPAEDNDIGAPQPSASPASTLEYKPEYIALPEGIRKIESIFTGAQIYFLAQRDDGAGIYAMEYDGTEIAELPEYAAPEGCVAVAMCLSDDGCGFWIAEYVAAGSADMENNANAGEANEYLLRRLDSNGAELASYIQEHAERTSDSGTSAAPTRSLVTDGYGSVYLFDSDYGVSVFDADGNKTTFLDKKGEAVLLSLFRETGGDVTALTL